MGGDDKDNDIELGESFNLASLSSSSLDFRYQFHDDLTMSYSVRLKSGLLILFVVVKTRRQDRERSARGNHSEPGIF